MIQVGTGGWGAFWCRNFLRPSIDEGLVEVIAAVDTDVDALTEGGALLGLPADRLFTSLGAAAAAQPADFCAVVVPPAHHEAVVEEAIAARLHVLCEKPIADTMAGAVRVQQKIHAAGLRMAVTMSHRFDQDKASLSETLRHSADGPLDHLSMRFSIAGREFGTFGRYRHEMDDVLMIDAAVHHFDLLRALAGAECESVYAETWTPAWAGYGGHSQGLVTMRFANQVRATYEGSMSAATSLHPWGKEMIRAELKGATITLDHRRLTRRAAVAGPSEQSLEEGIPLLQRPRWTHRWLLEQMVDWINGGPEPVTGAADNLSSLAMVFAAIESSRTGLPVSPAAVLARAAYGEVGRGPGV